MQRQRFNLLRLLVILMPLLVLSACGEQDTEKGEQEAKVGEENAKEKIEVHTFSPKDLTAHWHRKKDIERDSTKLKLGKVDLNLNVKNLSYTAEGELPVDSVSLTMFDGAFVSGFLSVDVSSARKLATNDEGNIKIAVPKYLDIENHPTIDLQFDVIGLVGDTLDLSTSISINGDRYDTPAKGLMPTWKNGDITSFYISLKLDALKAGLSAIDSDQKIRSDQLTVEIKK